MATAKPIQGEFLWKELQLATGCHAQYNAADEIGIERATFSRILNCTDGFEYEKYEQKLWKNKDGSPLLGYATSKRREFVFDSFVFLRNIKRLPTEHILERAPMLAREFLIANEYFTEDGDASAAFLRRFSAGPIQKSNIVQEDLPPIYQLQTIASFFSISDVMELTELQLLDAIHGKAFELKAMLDEANSSPDNPNSSSTEDLRSLPLHGRIAGGTPIESIANCMQTIDLTKYRVVSLPELALEAWRRGDLRAAGILYTAAKNIQHA